MEPARLQLHAATDRLAILTQGRDAIIGEAKALLAMADALDDEFSETVLALLATEGRIAVSGMGKSGHVGRKIAATLSATGQPAVFIHAGDALHGDLGALTAADTLLILSNSGETRECMAVATHARRLGCEVIAITARPDSGLARIADKVLLMPDASEVCPFDTSPTTSTTMMLAMGDALAVTAMVSRGASREQLRALHPAGRLARDFPRVT